MKSNLVIILTVFTNFLTAQTLIGGEKNFGSVAKNQYNWYFTQNIKNSELDKSLYNNKVFYKTVYLNDDYNKNGIVDLGDFRILSNDISKNKELGYVLLSVPGTPSDFIGSEIDFYTDCKNCISIYKDGVERNFSTINIFYRLSIDTHNYKPIVRAVESLPFLFEIPNNINKDSFTIQVGYTIRVARKDYFEQKRQGNYNNFISNFDGYSTPYSTLYSTQNFSWNLDSNSPPSRVETHRIEWNYEEILDKYIVIYTIKKK